MKRAILLLATALLGTSTACTSHSCDSAGDVNLFWNFGSTNGTCAQAGVTKVSVVIDGTENGPFDCTLAARDGSPVQGVTLLGFDSRPHTFDLAGLDASGGIIYSDVFTSPTDRTCGGNTFDRVLAPTDLTLAFTLTDATSRSIEACAPGSFIWFVLRDAAGQEVSRVDVNNNPRSIPCSAGAIAFSALPLGQYSVSAIAEVLLPGAGAPVTVTPLHATCDAQAFQHQTPGETAQVTVPASTGLCGF